MLTQLLNPDSPRAWLLWGALVVLALAQLAGIYMLCSQQVHRQHSREADRQTLRLAINDCLKDRKGSTFASCINQLAAGQDESFVRTGVMMTAHPGNFR